MQKRWSGEQNTDNDGKSPSTCTGRGVLPAGVSAPTEVIYDCLSPCCSQVLHSRKKPDAALQGQNMAKAWVLGASHWKTNVPQPQSFMIHTCITQDVDVYWPSSLKTGVVTRYWRIRRSLSNGQTTWRQTRNSLTCFASSHSFCWLESILLTMKNRSLPKWIAESKAPRLSFCP